MEYRTVQWSPGFVVVVMVFGLGALLSLALAALEDGEVPIPAILGGLSGFLAVALLVLTFSRLVVTVDRERVRAAFGLGFPRRSVPLDQVESVEPVRNPWWYGLGIRSVPGGWLWNVWGLDAVELRLRSGRVLRIGTAEPAELARELRRRIRS